MKYDFLCDWGFLAYAYETPRKAFLLGVSAGVVAWFLCMWWVLGGVMCGVMFRSQNAEGGGRMREDEEERGISTVAVAGI